MILKQPSLLLNGEATSSAEALREQSQGEWKHQKPKNPNQFFLFSSKKFLLKSLLSLSELPFSLPLTLEQAVVSF